MYKEIDELIETISLDKIFQEYLNAEKSLHDEKIMLLLSRQQSVQDDYLRMKQLQKYVSNDSLKDEYISLKKEVSENLTIQNYYQKYYIFNELLDDITQIVFHGISQEIIVDKFKL